jgi:nucleoside-diphosphate-sugar epimerase
MNMTRVLITGATGFIGRHLARAAVSQGYDVTGLVRATSATGRHGPCIAPRPYSCDSAVVR